MKSRIHSLSIRLHLALLFLSYSTLEKSDCVIDDAARDARLNLLRVSMRAAFNAVLLRTLLASHLISTVLRDVFVFMTVKALNDDESLAFFDLVIDD
jgi:hypothetical protein